MRLRNALRIGLLTAATLTVCAPAASAGDLLSSRVASAKPARHSCIASPLSSGRGVVTRRVTAPATGWVTARLHARSGDWDLGVFDSAGNRVAGSTEWGADEIAQGFVGAGTRLTVQACRLSGMSRTAALTIGSSAVRTPSRPERISLVRVATPNRFRKDELIKLGLDLGESAGRGYVDVLLHGAADARTLRARNFSYITRVGDVVAADRAAGRANARFAARHSHASARAAGIPSGRTTYRRLADYTSEMKRLAQRYPSLVKPLTLPLKTYSGRKVEGIEITTNPGNTSDGKPVFLNMGVHHAREWPAGENTMEFAYELINGYRRGDARIRRIVRSARTIIVPIVNPDGFNTSREAGQAAGAANGRGGNDTVNFAAIPYEYQRKNCRITTASGAGQGGNCTQQPASGLEQFGVDPNRNYGGFWGGPGASAEGGAPPGQFAQDYRGPGPFSEPESRNIRALVSRRQVMTLITNHTFSGLVLRPPGIQVQGAPPDEGIYKALGDAMAAQNGYTSQRSYQLYDTTGSTEDWSYYATGGLGFTFEIGCTNKNFATGECIDGYFHPPFASSVAEYDGTSNLSDRAGRNGGGNRVAYLEAEESTLNAARHSTLKGTAPPGAILRVQKSFRTATSPVVDSSGKPGAVRTFGDHLDTTLRVPDSGRFDWAINPSTRPIAAKTRGRPAHGRPSATVTASGGTPAAPCGAVDATNPACYKDYAFTVPAGAGIDNAKVTVAVKWATAASDYDVTVYRDTNGDGKSAGETHVVGSSAQGTTNSESTTFGEPAEALAGRKYVVRVVNFAGVEPYTITRSFAGPEAYQPAHKERWTLTCEGAGGKVGSRTTLLIDRGRTATRNFGARCARVACVSTRRGVKGKRVGPAYLGRSRKRQRRLIKNHRLHTRKGMDRYCVSGGGSLRIGYPTKRFNRRVSRRTRKRVKSRAILLITTAKGYRIKKLRVGSKLRTLRRRLRGERRLRIGKNTWYVARGKNARLVFRTRGGRVRELGLADRRATASRRGTRVLLTAWDRKRR